MASPRNTSSKCPFCGSKLMRGDAPRQLKCPKCEFRAGRDVIAVLNLERKYLTLKGLVPLAPMPDDPTLEVAVLPMKEWVRRKSLDATNNHKLMNEHLETNGYDKGCRKITIDPVRAIQRLRYLIPLATKHRGSAEAERVKQLVEHVIETGTIPSWARPRIAYTYPVPQPVQKKRRAVAVA